MSNDKFNPISETYLASLPYGTELNFPDEKGYRKEYHSDDLEWRELDGRWGDSARKAGARLASEYSEAKIWPGEHKNQQHKFVTGDRLDEIEAEADKLVGQSQQLFQSAQTQDDLIKAKTHIERAEGMYKAIQIIRGYHEGA